jgi:hypothetical protein
VIRPVAFAFAVLAVGCLPATAEVGRDDKTRPIIAQMLHDPDAYLRRRVTIYGLVIERPTRRKFVLQDVSQRPLAVVGRRGVKASVGDQVTVVGVLTRERSGSFVFVARSLVATRVLGGGGCC